MDTPDTYYELISKRIDRHDENVAKVTASQNTDRLVMKMAFVANFYRDR